MLRGVFSCGVVLAVLLSSSAAGAMDGSPRKTDEGTWHFAYDARVPSCPTRGQVRARIVARLGFDPFHDEGESELRITLEKDPQGLVATIERRGADGAPQSERTVRGGSDCGELATSAALAASILVDPTGAGAEAHAEGPVTKRSNAPRSRTPPTPLEVEESPWPKPEAKPAPARAGAALRLQLGARVLGSVGLGPVLTVGFTVDGALRIGQFELRLEGRGDLPASSDRLPDGAGVSTHLLLGTLAPCAVFDSLRLCGTLSAGGLFAESEALTPKETDATAFGAVGIRPMAELRLSPSARLVMSLEGALPLRPLHLTVRHQEVWASPLFTATAGAGFEVRFP